MADGDGLLLNMAASLLRVRRRDDDQPPLPKLLPAGHGHGRAGDQHYNLMSALHKTLRGSDADAALYWLARMFAGGEDPHYILRRLTRFASEDIGLAEPEALPRALAVASLKAGSPEGDRHRQPGDLSGPHRSPMLPMRH